MPESYEPGRRTPFLSAGSGRAAAPVGRRHEAETAEQQECSAEGARSLTGAAGAAGAVAGATDAGARTGAGAAGFAAGFGAGLAAGLAADGTDAGAAPGADGAAVAPGAGGAAVGAIGRTIGTGPARPWSGATSKASTGLVGARSVSYVNWT